MPINWDDSQIRYMLLLAITEADLKPTTTTWTAVAAKLGDVTPTAVSQKFYKLKKECEQLKAGGPASGPSTPAKTKPVTNGAAKTPGSGRGRKRKDASEDGASTKRTKKAARTEPEPEVEEDEDENENEAKAGVKGELEENDEIAD